MPKFDFYLMYPSISLVASEGSNPIYNLLPDILGRLCNQHLKEDTFCNIMQFLITSIKKVKCYIHYLHIFSELDIYWSVIVIPGQTNGSSCG
jgi:hypothetical protein